MVARTPFRLSRRRAAYSKRAGRPRNRLHEAAHEVLGAEASAHRSIVIDQASAGPAGQHTVDRLGRELRGHDRAMQPLARERIEESRRIADEDPAVAGPPRHRGADRPDPDRPVRDRRPLGGRVRRASGREDLHRDQHRAIGLDALGPRRAEDDSDVRPVAGDGREPHVPVPHDDHPGVRRGLLAGACDVEGDGRAPRIRWTTRDSGSASDHRPQPVGADDDGRSQLGTPPVRIGEHQPRRLLVQLDPFHAHAEPHVGAGWTRILEQGAVEELAVEADRGIRERPRAVVGQSEGGAASRLDSDRRDRVRPRARAGPPAGRCDAGPRPPPARRRRRTAANAIAAPARGARPGARERRAARPSPLPQDRLRPPRRRRVPGARRLSSGARRNHAGTAAIAQRCPASPMAAPIGRSPAS